MMSDLIAELREHERDYPSLIHGPLCGAAADEIERLKAENRRLHDTKRWNIKPDGDGLLICAGAHDKTEECQFYRYVMVRDTDQPTNAMAPEDRK